MRRLFTLIPLLAAALVSAQASRSAVVVTRASNAETAAFAQLLTPRLEGEVVAAGIAATRAEPLNNPEEQQRQARARGAAILLDVRVVSLARANFQAFGQDRRRLTATATWSATSLAGDLAAIGSGRATEMSVVDATLTEEEQADRLAETVAKALTAELVAKLATAPARPAANAAVTFRLVADGFTLPDIALDAEGRVTRSESTLRPALTGFTLEIDGVTQGSAGDAAVQVAPGIREVTVRRVGFEVWTRKVELRDGLVLEVAATPTAESLARLRGHAEFLLNLTHGAKLVDAEVERVRGAAAALRASGFKVDVKVDAKELPETVIAPIR